MKKFLAITPYFGGVSSAPRQTELDNVLRYFEYMYSSLKPYMTRLIVSVYNDEDYETVKLYGLNSDIDIIRIRDIDPIFLPANTVRIIQHEGFDEDHGGTDGRCGGPGGRRGIRLWLLVLAEILPFRDPSTPKKQKPRYLLGIGAGGHKRHTPCM